MNKSNVKTFSKTDLENIARLAKLDLSNSEKTAFSKELKTIFMQFGKINEANTEDVPPTYHVLDMTNPLRPDESVISSSEEILKIIPQKKERFVKAPRIL